MTSTGYIDNAKKLAASLHHHSCELPLTFSQIVLLRGLSITEVNRQTGPHYGTPAACTMYAEAGPEGTVIQFCDYRGSAPAEVGFTGSAYRSESRHVMNAVLSLSSGEFIQPPAGRNWNATLTMGDAGFELLAADDLEFARKYGSGHHRRRRWGQHSGAAGQYHSLNHYTSNNEGIRIELYSKKDEPVYGWSDTRNTTIVVPFFGSHPMQPRVVPAAEVVFSYDQFKKMLNQSGRKADSGGALYWSIDSSTERVYTCGYYRDGTESMAGSYVRGSLWLGNRDIQYYSSAIPYRPFGDAVVNRYKSATHGGFGFDIYGRPYIVLRWPWGYIRYCYVPLGHGGMAQDIMPETGQKCPSAKEAPPYVESWELNFDVAPYDPSQRDIIERWYRTYQAVKGVGAIMPDVPKKDEVYRWYIAFCQNGEVTEEDEILAQIILG